jgi:hypothetical protein
MAEQQSNINQNINTANAGLNLDQSLNQIPKGKLTYALNAAVENFDANSVSYQNEQGNEFCLNFPEGYRLIGKHFLPEVSKFIFFLANPTSDDSEIGYMDKNDCVYKKYINAKCLNFSIYYPIHKVVHKTTNCGIEIYWTDAYNERRFMLLSDLPFASEIRPENCNPIVRDEVDCNKLSIQPNFSIPDVKVIDVISGGNNIAGTYQFAIQYSNAAGDGYTSYYSVTNPLPLSNPQVTTPDFNYPVGKSIVLDISNIDTTGYFKYYNLAVIKTVNNIPAVELVGTFFIQDSQVQYTYSGQNQTQIRLTINDIFEKFPYYEIAGDLTAVQDVLVWDDLTSIDRINYQSIANQIKLQWETYRIPATENYANEENAANLRSYLRDEVYPFEIVFLLRNGKQTDRFHIPGRLPASDDLVTVANTNNDFIGTGETQPRWRVYNTATVLGTSPEYNTNPEYKGPYQYGEFSYWESADLYPCNEEVWGELAGKPIRHHKFPDVNISPIFESEQTFTNLNMDDRAIFPIGIRISVDDVRQAIFKSNLTAQEKSQIVGFKIVRGDRATNKSIIAKGILRNVGKYERQGTEYYFPNYPYNDLREDPFLLEKPNAFYQECKSYEISAGVDGTYTYVDCFSANESTVDITSGQAIQICSLTFPTTSNVAITVVPTEYDVYTITVTGKLTNSEFVTVAYTDINGVPQTITVVAGGFNKPRTVVKTIQVLDNSIPQVVNRDTVNFSVIKTDDVGNPNCYPSRLKAFEDDDYKYRHVFNSPETSFGQPFLGTILKLESVLYGTGKGHFVEVKNNALYKLISKQAQEDALTSSAELANYTSPSSFSAMFTAYQSYLQIYINGITRRNYGWSYNSIMNYNYQAKISNDLGIKQRELELSQYLIPGVQSVGDDLNINNFQRETSVYLKTFTELPAPHTTPEMLDVFGNPLLIDDTRRINSQEICSTPEAQFDINSVAYYGSIKNDFINQWGQIHSYESVDTGFQLIFGRETSDTQTIFGGDTFIGKFSFKTKLPFFIDNRVNAPDDSDIFYDEIGNVAYPEYWHSARSILFDYEIKDGPTTVSNMKNLISIKAHCFDCPNSQEPESTEISPNPGRTYYDGKMYMFAYGIPTFYVESSINVDLRQAFNNKEGDFYPHVSSGIPDDWLQQTNVPIIQDNTYYYNVTYSKQNKENFFTSLPIDWKNELCFTYFPYRAIFSETQQSVTDNRINNWLIYRPSAFFDFPQTWGKLTSLDGIENRQVLARFENKTLLYNALLTVPTSTAEAYLGQTLFSQQVPPLDYADTNNGYLGSQHKFLLKTEFGHLTLDAKRGQVFIISDQSVQDISKPGSGLNRFFTDNLSFQILNYFPDVDIDNHYNGIGLHGVQDTKYERLIITKLDYIPKSDEVKYDKSEKRFYIEVDKTGSVYKEYIELSDSDYFCNKSWTLSYNMSTGSWISFHSYEPNYYLSENNFFYSGINESCDFEVLAAIEIATTTTTTTEAPVFDCEMEGTAELYEADCDLDGEVVLVTTTTTLPPDCSLDGEAFFFSVETTTTTTTLSPTTTTTTTIEEPECDLDGEAVLVTTTTTTTLEPTTTTTSTTETPTTTTTSTTLEPQCDLDGTAIYEE